MSRLVGFVLRKSKKHDETLVNDLIDQVRKAADKADIKLPNRISIGGCFGSNEAYICYTSNAMRDLIIQVVKDSTIADLGGAYYRLHTEPSLSK